jgi:hypothetical protein
MGSCPHVQLREMDISPAGPGDALPDRLRCLTTLLELRCNTDERSQHRRAVRALSRRHPKRSSVRVACECLRWAMGAS